MNAPSLQQALLTVTCGRARQRTVQPGHGSSQVEKPRASAHVRDRVQSDLYKAIAGQRAHSGPLSARSSNIAGFTEARNRPCGKPRVAQRSLRRTHAQAHHLPGPAAAITASAAPALAQPAPAHAPAPAAAIISAAPWAA